MRKYLHIILLTFITISCTDNTDKALTWINEHPKPITVVYTGQDGITMSYRYTLIDSTGTVVYFDKVMPKLPDTIH